MDSKVIIIIAVIVFCCLISSSIAAFFLLQEDSKPVTSEEKKPTTSEETTTPATAQEEANSQYPAGSFGRLGYKCVKSGEPVDANGNVRFNYLIAKKDTANGLPHCATYDGSNCFWKKNSEDCNASLTKLPEKEIKKLMCTQTNINADGWCKEANKL